MSDTDSAPSASRRPEMTTFAPCSAKATAVALPIPEVPPVIKTTFSANDAFIEELNQKDDSRSALIQYPKYVPEGQPDSSQARSAWVEMQGGPVPEGRSKAWSVPEI